MYGVCCCGLAVWAWAARRGSQHPVFLIVRVLVLFFCVDVVACFAVIATEKVARGLSLLGRQVVYLLLSCLGVYFDWMFWALLFLRVKFRLCVYCARRHK